MTNPTDQIALMVDVVCAYVSNNSVATSDLPTLVNSVHTSLVAASKSVKAPHAVALTPAVSIKKSVTPEHLICLEDGKKFKSLKRHLSTKYGMSPEDYRAKWGLPKDYPMVAANYAAARSALAKKTGLGQQRNRAAGAAPPVKQKPKAAAEA